MLSKIGSLNKISRLFPKGVSIAPLQKKPASAFFATTPSSSDLGSGKSANVKAGDSAKSSHKTVFSII